MSNSNNKGTTWAARVRALNKDGWDENLERRVQGMTGEEWEALGMRVERAMDVLAVKAPRAHQRALDMITQYCSEANPGAAVVLGEGVIVLAAMLGYAGVEVVS